MGLGLIHSSEAPAEVSIRASSYRTSQRNPDFKVTEQLMLVFSHKNGCRETFQVKFRWFCSFSSFPKPHREDEPAQIKTSFEFPLGCAPSVPLLLIISRNELFRAALSAAKKSICWKAVSTRRHLRHPLKRVRHLRSSLCNLGARAFERAALTYLQMALIRLACLFKHRKKTTPGQSRLGEGRRSQGRDKSPFSAVLPRPSCNSSAEGKAKLETGRDTETQTEHKSAARRQQHAPAVQPKTKVCRLLRQLRTDAGP